MRLFRRRFKTPDGQWQTIKTWSVRVSVRGRVQEVARRMALSIRSVRTLIALGKLPVVRVGSRAIRVAEADLAAFIEARRIAPR